MDQDIGERHRMGATLTSDGCAFRVWAPNASRVTVMGDFNDWHDDQFDLQPVGDGIWSIEVPNVHAGAQYLYVIDNRGGDAWNPGDHGIRRTDPWARSLDDATGNSIVVDVEAELEASGLKGDSFHTPDPADWLIYQVHVGSFVGLGDELDPGDNLTGTFAQFEAKLGYIRSLGFNAIALLPIHENPGDGNEGYGPSHLFAPESSYGEPVALRHLIRIAHDLGLAVLFDVVWNHMSDFDNRLWDFDGMIQDGGIFFEGGERSAWGPRFATWKAEVRDFLVANAQMCFEEYHVDGLRVDAAEEILRSVLIDIVESVRAEPMWQPKLLIAEWTGGDPQVRQELIHDVGFDRIWALGDPHVFLAAVTDDDAHDVQHRTERLATLIQLFGGSTRIRYPLGSHDSAHDNEGGDREGYRHFIELVGGRDDASARAKARMGWALCVVLPGTPMCFMGSECLQPGYWHPRPDTNPVHGDHRFNWVFAGDAIGLQMRALVTDANRIWWELPLLRCDTPPELVHVDADAGVLAFLRSDSDGAGVLVVTNVSGTSWPDGYQLTVPGHDREWQVLLDSDGLAYGGASDGGSRFWSREGEVLTLAIAPWSVLVLG